MRILLVMPLLVAGCLAPALDDDPPLGATGPVIEPVAIDTGAGEAFEPMVAVDPADPDHLVVAASEYRSDPAGRSHRWNVAYASFDGGRTWTRNDIPGGIGAGPGHPLALATDMGDAVVAFLPDGTVLYAGIALNTVEGLVYRGYDLYVARSTDGGRTFPDVAIVASGRGVAVLTFQEAAVAWLANDKEWLAAGPDGTALLGWTEIEFPPTDNVALAEQDAVFSVSRDGGRTWTAPREVVSSGYSGSYPAIEADGTWHIALHEFGESMKLATSTDQGATWDLTTVAEPARYPTWPTLFARGGELFYGHSGRDGQSRPAARLVSSSDHGATWQERMLVPLQGNLTWPQHTFTVDGAGRLHALGYDGTSGEPVDILLWSQPGAGGDAKRSVLDAGLAGSVNTRGHYLGLAGLPDGAFAAWVTGDAGQFDLVGARVTWP